MAPQLPFRAPTEEPIVSVDKDKDGKVTGVQLSFGWMQHFQLSAQQLKTPANQTTPASSGQIGQHGQIAVGGGFFFVYDGTVGKWIKLAPVPF